MAKVVYKKQWAVPSDVDPDKTYKVSLTFDGEYKCSCPRWIFKREQCKHIRDVQAGVYDDMPAEVPEFVIVPCNVRQVELNDDRRTVCVPLVPIGDTNFTATVVYDALQFGVPWKTIADFEHLPNSWRKDKVVAYVKHFGRKIYGEWKEEQGYVGFTNIPV